MERNASQLGITCIRPIRPECAFNNAKDQTWNSPQSAAHFRQANIATEVRAVLQPSSVASLFFLVYKGVGFTLPTRLYARQREQGQTQITYFDEHSMQGGLV